jgi:hypothetical protein
MVLSWLLALSALPLSITGVAATGGFPPVVAPPGACGLDPADASCAAVFDQCVTTFVVVRIPTQLRINIDHCLAK